MKKLSVTLCAVLLFGALSLTACGNSSTESPKESSKDNESVAATETNAESAAESVAESETVAETEAETSRVTEATPESETLGETEPAKITYTVTVKDQNGDAVEGARVQMCQDELCMVPVKTNADGVATFSLEEATYHAKLAALPEGYTGDTEAEFDFPAGSYELVITITKA